MRAAETTTNRAMGAVETSLPSRAVRAAVSVIGFALLTALFAQVRIPVPGTVVPLTLQSAAVLLAGFYLSAPLAAAAMVLYVAAGLAGVPVFAPGSLGLAGATGGYIVGFVLGAVVVALMRGRSDGIGRLVSAGACGTLVIFACGVLWQVAFFDISAMAAWTGGVLPFLPKAVVQLGVVVSAVRALGNRRLSGRPSHTILAGLGGRRDGMK